ncbi:MAG: 3-deoxy-manno-octulosonate cytidylyltransferase [Verrucomicrobiota bacterium]|nr:3-deoxy-manno-octulosonate cytidylyltransferase [Verrucomicrobiota bacterium]
MKKTKTIAVIPARYGSTRFPGKPLALIAGKPMIQHVYEKAQQAKQINEVIVATDDDRIKDCVESFGGKIVMTAESHPSGTDRIAEAVEKSDAKIIVNIQGDEPLISPKIIDQLVCATIKSNAQMGTVAVPIQRSSNEAQDPNIVKVITNSDGYAIYFSRSLIPFMRDGADDCPPMKHWGLYSYKRNFLEKFVSWEQSSLEKCEKLEQLRAVEHGVKILVIKTDKQTYGVDTPEDILKVEAELQ